MGIPTEYRLVEVFSARHPEDETGSSGSGFLLGAGLVMTARHVLVPREWGEVPPDLAIFARALAEGSKAPLARASLVWPSDPMDLADRSSPDVALLRLASVPPDAASKVLVGRSRQERDDEARIDVRAGGFPKFMEGDERAPRESAQLTGWVEPFTGVKGGVYAIKDPDFKKRELDWKGMSGAALLANRALIGVVITQAYGNAVYDFRAQRIEPLLRDSGFREAILEGAELDLEVIGTNAPLPQISEHLWLIDREDHEDDFREAFRQCCPTTPLLCLIPGHWDHLPDELLSRFRRRTLPDLKWVRGGDFIPIAWTAESNPALAMARLRARLWKFLSNDPVVPADPQAFRAKLSQPQAPRLFRSEIAMGPHTLPSPAVLREWLSFWGQLSTGDDCPPVHIVLAPETTQSELTELLQSLLAPGLIVPGVTQDLRPCTPGHLKDWVSTLLPEELGMSPQDRMFMKLAQSLERRFSGPFPLKKLKDEIVDLVAGVTHV